MWVCIQFIILINNLGLINTEPFPVSVKRIIYNYKLSMPMGWTLFFHAFWKPLLCYLIKIWSSTEVPLFNCNRLIGQIKQKQWLFKQSLWENTYRIVIFIVISFRLNLPSLIVSESFDSIVDHESFNTSKIVDC